MNHYPDVFKDARERFLIADLWPRLGLPGEAPPPGRKFPSPFREDIHPSCDISKCGHWFSDRSRGLNLDAVGFVREALGGDWKVVVRWLIDQLQLRGTPTPTPVAQRLTSRPCPKQIRWPAELSRGTPETWDSFAATKRLPNFAIRSAVEAGYLHFTRVDGFACYVLTDNTQHAAEIRRCNGGIFPRSGRKAYPLAGVDKSWPIGGNVLMDPSTQQNAPVLICEGATDWLAAFGAYAVWQRSHCDRPWVPIAFLGASCRKLHPELQQSLQNRSVRIIPDGDRAGDEMASYWLGFLLARGCTVKVVETPRGSDLRDMLGRGEWKPEELFQ